MSGPGLVLWGLCVTFAAVDWPMSLEPHWFSSTYGVLIAAGSGVGAMALAIAVLSAVRDLPPWSHLATPWQFVAVVQGVLDLRAKVGAPAAKVIVDDVD